MDFLLNKVRTIVGEFHIGQNNENAVEFRYFRDKYLKMFKNYIVCDVAGNNITDKLFNEDFIDYYSQIVLHISNN